MVFLNECRVFFRDYTNLLFIVVFPLTMILLLGNMLKDLDYADAEVGKINAEFIIGTDVIETRAIEAFIENINAYGNINLTQASDANRAKNKIANKELDAFVEFNGENINLFEGENEIKNRSFFAILNGFLQNIKVPQHNVEVQKALLQRKNSIKIGVCLITMEFA